MEIDAELLLAGLLLIEAEHPVAAVVDDHDRDRQALLNGGSPLSAREQEATVAAQEPPMNRVVLSASSEAGVIVVMWRLLGSFTLY